MRLLLVFLAASWVLNAQQSEIKSIVNFTLEEAQNYALEHAYDIKSANFDIQAARKQVWETTANGLPQINATAGYSDALDIATQLFPDFITPAVYDINENKFGLTPDVPLPETEFFPVKFGQQFTGTAGLTVTQLLFDGTYIVGTQASRVFLQLSKDQQEKTKIEIKDLVASAYYAVLVAEKNYDILKQSLESNKKILHEVQSYYENGFREETDALQLQLLVNSSENQLADAKRLIENSKLLLKFVIGMDVDQPIKLTESLDKFIAAAMIEQVSVGNTTPNDHIDYKLLETQLKAQSLLLRSEKAKFLPSISAYYNYGKTAYGNEWNLFDGDDWFESSTIGLQVSMPIFTFGKQMARVSRQRILTDKLKNQLYQVEQNLKRERAEAYNNLLNAQEKFMNDKQGLELAKTIYDRTIIKFNEGVVNSTELSQNEQQYLQSLGTYIGSTLNLLNSKKLYLKVIGRL